MNAPKLRFNEFKSDWVEERLDNLGSLERGKSKHRPRNDIRLYGDSYPFIQTGDVKKAGLYLTESENFYSEFGLNQSKLWEKETLCITIAATIAETSILDIEACFPDSVIGFIPSRDKSSVIFIKLYFDHIKSYLSAMSEGVAQDNLNLEKLRKLVFKVPSLEEQQKIAEFFILLDRRIQKQQEKVEAWRDYKKGMMQKLFSQELRFKDEDGQEFKLWEKRKLGDISTIKRGEGLKKDLIVPNGQYSCILYGELFTKYGEVISSVESKTNTLNSIKSYYGDILMPSSDVTPNGLSKACCLLREGVLLGGDINIVTVNDGVSPIFMSYQINYFKEKIMKIVSGTTIKHVYPKDIQQLDYQIPEFDEQQKIAGFISVLDRKVEIEKKKVSLLQNQKKSFMQQMFV